MTFFALFKVVHAAPQYTDEVGKFCSLLLLNFLRTSCTKNHENRLVFDVTQIMSQPTATFIKINVCSVAKFVL